MKTRTTISIDEDLVKSATEYAENTGRTFSGFIRVCIRDKLKEVEYEAEE